MFSSSTFTLAGPKLAPRFRMLETPLDLDRRCAVELAVIAPVSIGLD